MVAYKQDMPPPGGYAPLNFMRVPAKTINVWWMVAAYVGITSIGWAIYHRDKRMLNIEKIRDRCGNVALIPLLTAENDRVVLKQLKKNRDYEEKLMADDPEWIVGRWKNIPVYLTIKPDEYIKPCYEEYFAHSDPKYLNFIRNLYLIT